LLPRFSILQIGDVHLPSSLIKSAAVDDKDARFPPDLKSIISNRPLKKAFEKIYEIISRREISAVLFMGDLTDYGNESGYKSCTKYISTALQIGANGSFKDMPVGIVSGNHDIDRLLAKSASPTTKFTPLVSALSGAGLYPPADV
jgi:calcineurin-like phosphoesterase family protein